MQTSHIAYEYVDEVEELTLHEPGGHHPIAIGDRLRDRYRILHRPGSGTIWLTRDLHRIKYVALKTVIADWKTNGADIFSHLANSFHYRSLQFRGTEWKTSMPCHRSGQMAFGQPDSQPVVRQDGEQLPTSVPTHVYEAIWMRKPAEELTLQDVSLVLIDFWRQVSPITSRKIQVARPDGYSEGDQEDTRR